MISDIKSALLKDQDVNSSEGQKPKHLVKIDDNELSDSESSGSEEEISNNGSDQYVGED